MTDEQPAQRLRRLVSAAFERERHYDATIGEVQRLMSLDPPVTERTVLEENATLRVGAHVQAAKVAELRALIRDHVQIIADQALELEQLRGAL